MDFSKTVSLQLHHLKFFVTAKTQVLFLRLLEASLFFKAFWQMRLTSNLCSNKIRSQSVQIT